MTSIDVRRETVLVFGASGHQGGSVAKHLLNEPNRWKVRAFVHHMDSNASALAYDGAEVIVGDMRDRDLLRRAMKDVEQVFLNTEHSRSKGDEEYEIEEGRAFVTVASAFKQQIKQVVYSWLPNNHSNPESRPKDAIAKMLKASALPVVQVMPAFYLEDFLEVWPITKRYGLFGRDEFWVLPINKGADPRMPHVSIEDFGGIVKGIMARGDQYVGRSVMAVTADGPLSSTLNTISKSTNRPITLNPMSQKVYKYMPFPRRIRYELMGLGRCVSSAGFASSLDEVTGNTVERNITQCRELYTDRKSVV